MTPVQHALKLSMQFHEVSMPMSAEAVIGLVATFLIGMLIVYAAHDELGRRHQ